MKPVYKFVKPASFLTASSGFSFGFKKKSNCTDVCGQDGQFYICWFKNQILVCLVFIYTFFLRLCLLGSVDCRISNLCDTKCPLVETLNTHSMAKLHFFHLFFFSNFLTFAGHFHYLLLGQWRVFRQDSEGREQGPLAKDPRLELNQVRLWLNQVSQTGTIQFNLSFISYYKCRYQQIGKWLILAGNSSLPLQEPGLSNS